MALKYTELSKEVQERVFSDRQKHTENPYRCQDQSVVRRNAGRDVANLWRPTFVRDTEKIIHCPFYNRYADKTQVFSFYRNDDITRRALHVQLVSRISRNIGTLL
jgi:dGTPase